MGERQEGDESYSEVVFSRSGAAGRGVGGEAELGGGCGAPARLLGEARAGSFVRVWGR